MFILLSSCATENSKIFKIYDDFASNRKPLLLLDSAFLIVLSLWSWMNSRQHRISWNGETFNMQVQCPLEQTLKTFQPTESKAFWQTKTGKLIWEASQIDQNLIAAKSKYGVSPKNNNQLFNELQKNFKST